MPTPTLQKVEKDLEVQFKPDLGKAVIEGRTAVPFQAFVTLVLQRKVVPMFKQWGREPIIVGSELLTNLASAPQDSQENRANLILVSIGVGVILGVGVFAAVEIALIFLKFTLGVRELSILLGGIAGVGLLAFVLMKTKRTKKNERIVEAMEGFSSFLSGK